MDWLQYLDIVAYIISGASIIVKVTPTKKDDEVVGKLSQILFGIRKVFEVASLAEKKK